MSKAKQTMGGEMKMMNPGEKATKKKLCAIAIRIAFSAVGVATMIFSGCAICCGPYDYHYPTHGGSVQRSDPVNGRVGSLFSDPGPFGGPSADYNLTEHDAGQGRDENFNRLEDLDNGENNSSSLSPPENMLDEPDSGGQDVLPPPKADEQRPGPDDDSTSIRRLRNQSRRGRNRWR